MGFCLITSNGRSRNRQVVPPVIPPEVEEEEKKKKDPLVSVVIPVYNVEDYLDATLHSIRSQTLNDTEIICIDDGSTDGSLRIIYEHAKNDSRIVIVTQENQGPGIARNVGMDMASGKFLYFMDSDDIILPYTLEKSVALLEEYEADVIQFKYAKIHGKGVPSLHAYQWNDFLKPDVREYKEGCDTIRTFNIYLATWKYVYRRQPLIESGIRYIPNATICEDLVFSVLANSFVKKMLFDKNIGYLYRSGRKNSLFNPPPQERYKLFSHSIIEGIRALESNFYRFNYTGSADSLCNIMFGMAFGEFDRLKGDKETRNEFARIMVREIKDNFIDKLGLVLSDEQKANLEKLISFTNN